MNDIQNGAAPRNMMFCKSRSWYGWGHTHLAMLRRRFIGAIRREGGGGGGRLAHCACLQQGKSELNFVSYLQLRVCNACIYRVSGRADIWVPHAMQRES